MMFLLRPALATVLLLAPLSAAAGQDPLAAHVPEDALALLEFPSPSTSWERALRSEPARRFFTGPLAEEVWRQPQIAPLKLALAPLENAAGSLDAFVDALAGDGLVLALLAAEPEARWVLVARPGDVDVAEEGIRPLLAFATGGEADISGEQWDVALDGVVLARRGERIFAASDRATVDTVAATAGTGALASRPSYREAVDALGETDVRLWLRGDLLRADGYPELPEDGGASFFGAGLHEALRVADWVVAGLDFDPRGPRLRALAPAPAGLRASHAPFFPEPRTIAIPQVGDALGAMLLRRDLGAWWTARELYMNERAVADSVQGDGDLSLLFGRDLGSEVFAWLEPELLALSARLPDAAALDLEIEFPGVAVGMWLEEGHPEDLPLAFTTAFLGAITFTNFESGSRGDRGLMIDAETHPDGRLYATRYREAPTDAPAPPHHNLSPALWIGDDGEIWMSSSTALLEAILAAPRHEREVRHDWMHVHLRPGIALLEEAREVLVAQRLLEEGGDEDAAQTFVDRLLAGAGLVDGGDLRFGLVGDVFELEIALWATPDGAEIHGASH